MSFPIRSHVLRHYKNEIWEGIVLSTIRLPDGNQGIVCQAIGKEFKLFVSDPSHLEVKIVKQEESRPDR